VANWEPMCRVTTVTESVASVYGFALFLKYSISDFRVVPLYEA